MNIACICSTKNEGDMIEAFVRLNGRICNSFFFVDDSTDHTRDILALLTAEGYDINFLQTVAGGYNQPKPQSAYLRYVKQHQNPDWIFLLDADEIIVAPDPEQLFNEMRTVPPDTFLSAGWKTFVPTSLDYFESTSPFSECFGIRPEKGKVFRKISLPGQLADKIIPITGNHNARSLTKTVIREKFAEAYYLAHFPVRSAEQIIVKNLMAAHNLKIHVDNELGEGSHVFTILHQLRKSNYSLTLQDLASMAINYACDDHSPVSAPFPDLDLSDNSLVKTELRYSHLARINVIERLDKEIERLSLKIRENREKLIGVRIKLLAKNILRKIMHN